MAGTALILGPGGLYGGYGAGVASVLGRHIKFDRFYGCSVGVFASTFSATEQFDVMLEVWRNHVHSKLLINFKNVVRGRNILDLEYLVGLFQKEPFLLDLKRLDQERSRLVHVLTEVKTGNAKYRHPSSHDVFNSMTASSAVPHIHPVVEIDGICYRDGALSNPYPIQRALADGFNRIIVVTNFPVFYRSKLLYFSKLARKVHKKSIEEIMSILDLAEQHDIRLLRPEYSVIRNEVDTHKERINQTIDIGIEDAERFLESWN